MVLKIAPNSSAFVRTWIGTAVAGLVEVPINTAYEVLSEADQASSLTGEDLELLAAAAYLLGLQFSLATWQAEYERIGQSMKMEDIARISDDPYVPG